MNKLNHMICPTCGHDFYVGQQYTRHITRRGAQ